MRAVQGNAGFIHAKVVRPIGQGVLDTPLASKPAMAAVQLAFSRRYRCFSRSLKEISRTLATGKGQALPFNPVCGAVACRRVAPNVLSTSSSAAVPRHKGKPPIW